MRQGSHTSASLSSHEKDYISENSSTTYDLSYNDTEESFENWLGVMQDRELSHYESGLFKKSKQKCSRYSYSIKIVESILGSILLLIF